MHNYKTTRRAFQLYQSYNPHYFPLRLFQIVFTNLTPFFTLWMSAEIVTALYEKKTKEELFLLVAIALLGNLFIHVMGALLGRCVDNARKQLEDNEAAAFNKKTLSLDSPDTCIKVRFNPDDTIDEVYEKFNAAVSEVQSKPDEKNSFDKLNKALVFIPGLFLRWTVKLLNFLDYFGLLPKFLLWLSPFHGSMIITSMGSLGIRPIYHHIYNFGNLPVFLAYGGRRTVVSLDADGKPVNKKFIEMKAVTDERICDGYYYASAFKIIKRCVENPELLDVKPEQVLDDID